MSVATVTHHPRQAPSTGTAEVRVDRDLIVRGWTAEWLFDYTAAEAIGQPWNDLVGRARPHGSRDADLAELEANGALEVEGEWIDRTGRPVHAHVLIGPADGGGWLARFTRTSAHVELDQIFSQIDRRADHDKARHRIRTEFDRRLRAARLEAGLTQDELGELVGVRPNEISRWEHSAGPSGVLPSPVNRQRLARALNIDPKRLWPEWDQE